MFVVSPFLEGGSWLVLGFGVAHRLSSSQASQPNVPLGSLLFLSYQRQAQKLVDAAVRRDKAPYASES